MQLSKHYVPTSDYAIPVLELLPDGAARPPAVILCPGAGGDKYQVLENMARLAECGLATLSLDGPELGERRTALGMPRAAVEGPSAHMRWLEMGLQYARDFAAVLTWWLAQGRIDADRLGAWGRSFGANCLFYALQDERRIRAAAAVIGTPNNLETLRRRLELLSDRGPGPTSEMWQEAQRRFGPRTAVENVGKLVHLPLLACWGADDTTMPLETVTVPFVERMEAWPQPKAEFVHRVYPGTGHAATAAMQADWIAWFRKHLA